MRSLVEASAKLSMFCLGAIAFVEFCPTRATGLSDDPFTPGLGRLGELAILAAVADCVLSVAVLCLTPEPHSAWLWIGLGMSLAVVALLPAIASA